jgi:hypothetical protein
MQESRQTESVQWPIASPLPSPHNKLASILRCLAIAAIACFLALPSRLVAQSPTKKFQCCWAGYILYAPGQVPLQFPNTPFTTIEAEWVVPDATPTIDCSNPKEQLDGSSIWIGLDGWSYTYNDAPPSGAADTDILQAGTETDIHCKDDSHHNATAYFWIQWDGTASIPVTPGHVTVQVPIGDLVHVRIAVDTTTSPWQQATVYFEDKSPGGATYTTTFHSGCLYTYCSPPHNLRFASLFGNTAEWVVESTFYATQQDPGLPNTTNNFATTQMTQMSVTDINGTVYTPGNPGTNTKPELDWMSWLGPGYPLDYDPPDHPDKGNALLACAAVADAQTITLTRAPFDVVAPGHQGALEPKPLNCN